MVTMSTISLMESYKIRTDDLRMIMWLLFGCVRMSGS